MSTTRHGSTSTPPPDHHPGPARYVIVWAALLVFTALTVGLGRIHLGGGWSIIVAMAIAVVKSTLVVLFFMHLWDHGGANRLVLGTTLVFVALLMGLVLMDNGTRYPLGNPPTEETARVMAPGPDILTPRVPAPAPQH